MKKRAMKKWIPKNTMYCDGCKWLRYIKTIYLHKNPKKLKLLDVPNVVVEKCQHAEECNDECWTSDMTRCHKEVWRCEYLGFTDYEQDSLLLDGCKECGVSLGN